MTQLGRTCTSSKTHNTLKLYGIVAQSGVVIWTHMHIELTADTLKTKFHISFKIVQDLVYVCLLRCGLFAVLHIVLSVVL